MSANARPFRLVVLISGNGSNLQALIDAIAKGELQATIAGVISNRVDAYGLVRAKQAHISTQILLNKDFNSREAYDVALQAYVAAYQPDLIILAGFMRILGSGFVQHFAGRILNIHPSLLPRHPGLHTHERVIAAGELEHGVSVHFVTEELDGGPLIAQAKIEVNTTDTAESLRQKIHVLEHQLYPQVIQWIVEKKLSLQGKRIYFLNKCLTSPIQLELDSNSSL